MIMQILPKVILALVISIAFAHVSYAQTPSCQVDGKTKCKVVTPNPCEGKVDAANNPATCMFSITGYLKCKCKGAFGVKTCSWGWEVMPDGRSCTCNDKESRAKKCKRCKDKVEAIRKDPTMASLPSEGDETQAPEDEGEVNPAQVQIPGQGQILPIPKITIPPIGGNCENEGEIKELSCMIEDYDKDGKKIEPKKSCEAEEFDITPVAPQF